MKKLVLNLALLMLSLSGMAQVNKNDKGIAIEGYDVVSYFEGKAQKGKELYSVKFKTASYYFSSEKNKKAFIANPSKYLPCYGGYCAYAMGEDGSLVEVDPETFKILDGKLYLFYNQYFHNTKTLWNKDEKNLKQKADVNWIKLTSD